MKNTLKLALAVAIFALCGKVSAQNEKLTYIDINELVVLMPEYDTAMVKLQKVATDLENAMEEMQVEYNRKLDEYSRNQESWTDLVRQSKGQELQQMGQRIQMFQESASESYGIEQQKLTQPVIEKANKAIETVAKEKGITMVINAQVLLYKAVSTVDLLPAVKQHLGIKN